MSDAEPSAEVQDFKIWDLSIRVFHWSLAVLIFLLWQTGESGSLDTHRKLGVGVLALLVYRLYWGFFGPKTARFTAYPITPRQVFTYLPKLFKKPYKATVGHSPLASLSVLAIFAILGFQVATGLFAIDTDGLFSGYFAHLVRFDTARQLANLHVDSFDIISALVLLHLFAISYYLFALATDLVTAMITGKRDVDAAMASKHSPATVRVLHLCIALGLATVAGAIVLYFGR
ncbi:MAG: cytochrome b/b6 domain-containing protein [Pseudomonadota bacterium]